MAQGPISPEIIRHIKDRLDITEVVGGYVALTKTGQNLKGLCPFHAEKTPSFTVSPSRQMFHCFGCGVGGDVVEFVMKRERLGFVETLQELGRKVGVEVKVATGARNSPDEGKRERVRQINQSAARWFRDNLKDVVRGREARQYLLSRGISEKTAEEFGLGYALPSWDGLLRDLGKRGISAADITSAGLVVEKEVGGAGKTGGTRYYDRFRDRIMFPIHDVRKQVIGFGGRVLGDELPKYLNSSESPLFRKGSALYGIEKIREATGPMESVIIVEGYFDAVALHQAGVHNVVATLGTALTSDHIGILRRFTQRVVLLFDSDAAGTRAALRTLDLFRNSGMGVRVVTLPQGDDPDTFIRREGVRAFAQLEGQAPSLVEFAVEQSLRDVGAADLDIRIRRVDDVLQILQKSDNRIEKEECLRVVAERLGISQTGLIQRYPELLRTGRGKGKGPGSVPPSPHPHNQFKRNPEERDLVRLLLKGYFTAAQVHTLSSAAFSVPVLRKIVAMTLEHRDAGGRVLVDEALRDIAEDSECGSIATELCLTDEIDDNPEASIQGCLSRLEQKRHDEQLRVLVTQLKHAEREGLTEEVDRLNAQVNELRLHKAWQASQPVPSS